LHADYATGANAAISYGQDVTVNGTIKYLDYGGIQQLDEASKAFLVEVRKELRSDLS